MTILVIDVGTTHCKAGLFAADGAALHIATRPTPRAAAGGATVIPAEALWDAVGGAVAEVVAAAGRPAIAAVGVASMAESGLLVDRRSGAARTPLLPWFDQAAAPFAAALAGRGDGAARFRAFGIHPSFKCSLAKIMQLRHERPALVEGAVWLCAADYIAFRLSGAMASDYSLAGRTYAFDLWARQWDAGWLRELGLPADIFPPALPSGAPLGAVGDDGAALGLARGTPVAIGGHDHICAAVAAGATGPGRALDSMGTAEALLGASPPPALDDAARRSGLTFGLLPLTGGWYWLGGLSASGGSLDWLRGVLGDPPLGYEQLQAMQAALDPEPGELIYLPYLAGSGPPSPNPAARGAFIGLASHHTRADLLRAVLEGAAFQIESIRRAAVAVTGQVADTIVAAGGGARNRRWLQIKADVAGLPLRALATDEATLLGAALTAGTGCGAYRDGAEALGVAAGQPAATIEPDMGRHRRYQERFERFQHWRQLLTAQ
jgi:sugar (pentulose or hexulose) kinase